MERRAYICSAHDSRKYASIVFPPPPPPVFPRVFHSRGNFRRWEARVRERKKSKGKKYGAVSMIRFGHR